MRFFIPHLKENAKAGWTEFRRYIARSSAPADSRPVYRLEYQHEGDRYVVTVGEKRLRFRRRTGPRGGYIKDAGQVPYSLPTGTVVSGIVDGGQVIYVWSYGPPFDGWANPSMVGKSEVLSVTYFEDEISSTLP